MCKNCTNQHIKDYTAVMGSESAAFWLVCAEQSVPFIRSVWDVTATFLLTAHTSTDRFTLYLSSLIENGGTYTGFWDSDTMLDQLIDKVEVNRDAIQETVDYVEQQKIWGKFLDDKGRLDEEAYDFLNQTYDSYTKEVIGMDANLENRYRDLSKCEFRLRKANELGDGAEISKAQDSLNKQLALLKLNEFRSNNKTDEQLAFEKRVAMIEYSKPAECEDLKKYLDMVGFEKDKSSMMRSLRNAIAETRNYPDIPKEERV